MFARQKIQPLYHKLLYVEDHPANLILVESLMARRADWKLLKAINANMGIAMTRTNLPEVILMDINLPSMNGFKVLEILSEDPDILHIPVVALSSNTFPHQIEKGIWAEFFRYVKKQYKINDLMNSLDDSIHFSLSFNYSAPIQV